MVRFSRGRLALGLLTLLLVAAAIATLLWSANSLATTLLKPSDAAAAKRGATVRVAGAVVESSRVGGVMRLKLADPDAPSSAVLDAVYSGPQRLSFGPGLEVVATGVMVAGGVLEVSEFVTKAPASR